jgi:hypothetical protein
MRAEDVMLQAQRDYIEVLRRFIRAICTTLEMGGTVDTRMLRDAIDDEAGPIPEKELPQEDTAPVEHDDLTAYRRGHRPTIAVEPLSEATAALLETAPYGGRRL